MTPLQYLLIVAVAYLLGSFSSGIFLASLQGRDIRAEGSKSSGATNVTRVLGIKLGLLTFAGDFLKTALAVAFGRLISGQSGAMAAGIFAVAGHNWPVYYQFRGGKGIVCSATVLLLIFPVEALISAALFFAVTITSKFVSLGSLALLLSGVILLTSFKGFIPAGLWALVLFLLAVYQHRSNITRLIKGEENRFSLKKR